jgi:hypothetical protein
MALSDGANAAFILRGNPRPEIRLEPPFVGLWRKLMKMKISPLSILGESRKTQLYKHNRE